MDFTRSIEALKQLIAESPLGPTTAYYAIVPRDFEGNIAWRRMIWELSADPLIQEELRVICSRDMMFYTATFGWTFSPKDETEFPEQPFIPWPAQELAMLELQRSYGKYPIVGPKSRGVGFSWMCLYVIEWFWHFRDWQSALLCSRKADYVDKTDNMDALFPKVDFIHSHQPEWLLPNGRELLDKDSNRMNGHVKNAQTKSVIDGEATVSNIGRGGRRGVGLLDEFPAIPEARAMAKSMSETTNSAWYVGTPTDPFGIGKPFQDMIKNPHIKKIWLHWSQDPRRNQGLYILRKTKGDDGLDKVVREELDPTIYNFLEDWPFPVHGEHNKPRSPWYDAKALELNDPGAMAQEYDINGEATLDRLATVEAIDMAKREFGRPARLTGEVLPLGDTVNGQLSKMQPVWREGVGNLELWCDLVSGTLEPIKYHNQVSQDNAPPRIIELLKEPPQTVRYGRPPRGTYAIGCDISAGAGGKFSSYSAMSIWDCRTGHQVGEWRSNTVRPEQMGVKAVVLAKWFWDALIVPEVNGDWGRLFVSKLLECGYTHIYERNKSEVEVIETKTTKLGWFSSAGPGAILESLLASMADGNETTRAKPHSLLMLDELLEYEWVGEGKVEHVKSKRSERASDKGRAHGDAAVAGALGWLGVLDCDLLSAKKSGTEATVDSKKAMDDWYYEGQENRYAESANAFNW